MLQDMRGSGVFVIGAPVVIVQTRTNIGVSSVLVAWRAMMVSALLVQSAQSHLRTEHRAMRAPQA